MLKIGKPTDAARDRHHLHDRIVMRTLIPSDDGDSDLDDETSDPLEWKDLIANITETSLPGTIIQSQLNLALRLLKDTLVHLFQTP
jgi:hypothetical protein